MEDNISKERFLLGSYSNISSLFELAGENELYPQIEPTVFINNPLVHFVAKDMPLDEQKEKLENILAYMQPTFINCMQPYKVDEPAAQKFYAHTIKYLKKIKPEIEFVVSDISGKRIAGEASNIHGAELLAAGVPCYCSGANPVQITVLNDKERGLYAMRLPWKPEMYSVAKTDFPSQKVLGGMEDLAIFFEDYKELIK